MVDKKTPTEKTQGEYIPAKLNFVLSDIQKRLKAPKNQYNKFGNYYYRNCEDILEGVKPLLPQDCFITLSDEICNVGERYYVKATAAITNGVDLISNTAYAREATDKKGMDDSQITGAASSYARKYALNGLFAIDDGQDADTQDNTKPTPKPIQQIDVPTMQKLRKLAEEKGKSHDDVIDFVKRAFNKTELIALTAIEARQVIAKLNAMPDVELENEV